MEGVRQDTCLQEQSNTVSESNLLEVPKKTLVSPTKTPNKRVVDDVENTEPIKKKLRAATADANARFAPTFVSPVLWSGDAGVSITALLVDGADVIVATKDGLIAWLSSSGTVRRHMLLECPVSALMRDGATLYAWGHSPAAYTKWKGALFDITNAKPRLVLEIENLGEWLLYAGVNKHRVVVGDDKGTFALVGCHGEIIWKKETKDGGSKMFLLDDTGIYVGHKKRVAKYSYTTGSQIWSYDVTGRFVTVQRAVQTAEHIYVDAAGQIHQIAKNSGDVTRIFSPLRHRAAGVCLKDELLITGSCPTVLFNIENGTELYHMNYAGRLGDSIMAMDDDHKLYVAWDKVYCIDLSTKAIERAVAGRSTGTQELSIKKQVQEMNANRPQLTESETLVVAHERPVRGHLVRCSEECVMVEQTVKTTDVSENTESEDTEKTEVVKVEEKRLVVKPLGHDLYNNWHVRFPINLMTANMKYVVETLTADEEHKFYCASGDIREYDDKATSATSTRNKEDDSTAGDDGTRDGAGADGVTKVESATSDDVTTTSDTTLPQPESSSTEQQQQQQQHLDMSIDQPQ